MVTSVILFLLCFIYKTGCHEKQVYRIGGLFNDESDSLAFKTAVDIMNKKYEFSQMYLEPIPVVIPAHNALLAYNNACKLLKEGIIGLFGPSSPHSSTYIQALCDQKEIPHIETHRDLNLGRDNTVVNIYPHPKVMSNLFFDLIRAFDWHTLIILYDNNENLLSVASVLEFNNLGRTVVLRQLEIEQGKEVDEYRPILTKVKLTGETRFLLVCSIGILGAVLKQLQEVGMMTNTYSYIIANLDMHTVELQPYQYAGTNITGVRMIDPDHNEVIRTAGDIQKRRRNTDLDEGTDYIAAWKLKLDAALIVDAVQLFYETIYSLTEDKNMIINPRPISCNPYDNWGDGYTIINSMKMKTVNGLTGLVKFGVEGFRNDFLVNILELAPGSVLKVGSWNSTSRNFKFARPYKPQLETKPESLFNRTFTVLISISAPYAMLKEKTSQLVGNDRYEGYCVDLIDELARILGFNYTFVVQEDGANGNLNKTTNEWNGMIGQVIAGKADFAITDLTITSEREKAVDFTMPFMNLGISILYRKPEPVPPSLFMFASPFSLSVWIMLGVSYFIVSIAFFVMGRMSHREWQNPYPCVEEPEYLVNQFTIKNSLWFTTGALMQQGSELAPIAISIRTAAGVWWFFVLIMGSSYTANLAAFLTVETLVTPFKNINELAAQTEIKYGAKSGGATANYFKESNVTVYKNIWKYMARHPENMADSEDGRKRVESENYAYLMESTTIEYATERFCSLAQVGGLLDDKGYGIAMAKDSPYRSELSTTVLKLQEAGTLTGLKIKWWKEKRGGGKCSRKPEAGEATALDLKNVGGVFLVLFMGSLMGIVGSFIELSRYVYRKCKTKKLSFKEEMKKELRFFLKFKQYVKEISEPGSEDGNDNTLIEKTTHIDFR